MIASDLIDFKNDSYIYLFIYDYIYMYIFYMLFEICVIHLWLLINFDFFQYMITTSHYSFILRLYQISLSVYYSSFIYNYSCISGFYKPPSEFVFQYMITIFIIHFVTPEIRKVKKGKENHKLKRVDSSSPGRNSASRSGIRV